MLQARVGKDGLDQPLPEPGIALPGDDKDVREIGKSRLVGNDAGKADLRVVAIDAEGQGMRDCAPQYVARDAARPMRALGEKMMDQGEVEAALVAVDFVDPAADFAASDDAVGHQICPALLEAETMPARLAGAHESSLGQSAGLLAHSSSQEAE